MFKIKSIYEPADKEDGFRILVDKTWPEGLSKEDAKVDLWLKEIAPTKDTDKWITENTVDFEGFKEEYHRELRKKKTLISIILNFEKENGTVTLLYSKHDPECNCVAVLKDKLNGYRTIRRSVGRLHGG
ncbi:MAG: DUF488 family protein [Methanobacterium sp.]